MVFFAALLFAGLLFVIPGEVLLVVVAKWSGGSEFEEHLILCALNVLVFLGLVIVFRGTRFVVHQLGWEDGRLTRQLDSLLDVTSWRWLNAFGLVGIGAGVSMLGMAGRVPFPFWFLFAAILIGLLDLVGAGKRGHRPKMRPTPKFVPSPAPEPTPAPAPTPAVPGKTVVYHWSFLNPDKDGAPIEQTREFFLEEGEYAEAGSRERFPKQPVREYANYVTCGFSPSVRKIAEDFRRETDKEDYSTLVEAMNIVGFARGIRYKTDEETRGVPDYGNFPIETLYDEAGDCEDHAILAATLLHNLGHDVGLFHLRLSDSGHLALAYRPPGAAIVASGPFSATDEDGREYYYVETVPTDAEEGLGDISEEFLDDLEGKTLVPIA